MPRSRRVFSARRLDLHRPSRAVDRARKETTARGSRTFVHIRDGFGWACATIERGRDDPFFFVFCDPILWSGLVILSRTTRRDSFHEEAPFTCILSVGFVRSFCLADLSRRSKRLRREDCRRHRATGASSHSYPELAPDTKTQLVRTTSTE